MKRIIIVLLLFAGLLRLSAQPLSSIYENKTLVSFDKYIYNPDSAFHTSVRPYLLSEFRKNFDYDSARSSYNIKKFSGSPAHYTSRRPSDVIFNTNLFIVRKDDYGFTIDPLFDFGYGSDFANDRSTWINTRGFLIEGYLGNDFAFSTQFYETQSKVPLWIHNYVGLRGNMPGQGWVKGFGNDAFDYANAAGYVSWSPGRYFNFRMGHGKQFLGDGYRSLMLSDHSLYHPYFMATTTFWKIKYVNLFSQFSHPDVVDHRTSGDVIYAKKYSTMHYLSFIPWKKFNLSLFESITWQAYDSSYYRGFELSYLNPVIFYRPVEFNLGSGDNAMIGANLRYTPFKGITVYGQFVADEFKIKEFISGNGWWGNKFAWQAGIKTFGLAGIENLDLQAEYNLIRPYMYSHYTQVQNYSNAKEPLAHPSGANVKEAVAIANYNYRRIYFNFKYVWSGSGLDSSGMNFGKNIFSNPQNVPDEYGNFTGQGLYTTLNQLDFSVSFLVNPATNLNLFIGATLREEKNSGIKKEYAWFSFGLRTSLRNLYYDFY